MWHTWTKLADPGRLADKFVQQVFIAYKCIYIYPRHLIQVQPVISSVGGHQVLVKTEVHTISHRLKNRQHNNIQAELREKSTEEKQKR